MKVTRETFERGAKMSPRSISFTPPKNHPPKSRKSDENWWSLFPPFLIIGESEIDGITPLRKDPFSLNFA